MENEFQHLDVRVPSFSLPRLGRFLNFLIHLVQLTCDGAYVIPRNTGGNVDKYPYGHLVNRLFPGVLIYRVVLN